MNREDGEKKLDKKRITVREKAFLMVQCPAKVSRWSAGEPDYPQKLKVLGGIEAKFCK